MVNKKTALVMGGGGFIGSHMVNSLKSEGFFVRAVDISKPSFSESEADEFIQYDLTQQESFEDILNVDGNSFDEIYQFAADMGGAGYIFSGEYDADIMSSSCIININFLNFQQELENITNKKSRIFYSSSACIYPEYNQLEPDNPNCTEESAYPAQPDSEYGWEKLFSERLYLSYLRNYKMDIHIARYHNIFGPQGAFDNGKEKAPAAICRKVALSDYDGEIEIWGDGQQTRSFLYIDECLKATKKLIRSKFVGPVNIGSEEMVTINELVRIVAEISEKKIKVKHIDGPLGVRGRNSDNKLINEKLGWNYKMTLKEGLTETYNWIESQIEKN
tara:strand:+ start:3185 stop:4180 length:996 start_codon:yes stop_codon:yes gene_type:complete